MLQTYKAVLRGNTLEWKGEKPPQSREDDPVPVHVTILEEPSSTKGSDLHAGAQMAAVLDQLASIHALSDIQDPTEWQREQRQDNELLGRE